MSVRLVGNRQVVLAGQIIARTAKNGWICSPQLHFGIYASPDHLYDSSARKTIPVYFDGLPEGLARQGYRGVVPTGEPRIISLGAEFEQFWHKAKNLSFDQQLNVWNSIIEVPHQAFFDAIVWGKKENPKWQERRLRLLKKYFVVYSKISPEITENFRAFPKTLKYQIQRFKNTFPDAKFALSIYAAPTASFNGKGGEGGDGSDELGKTVLAFGIDVLTERHDNPDVLYSHELFHIYHANKANIDEKVFLSQGKLTLPLWMEGLATYVSELANPNAPISDVLMDKALPKVPEQDIQWLAKEFIADANAKAFDQEHPEIYKRWFAIGSGSIRKDLPERCGYLLGLRLVEHLSKTYSLAEMTNWHVSRIHEEVLRALEDLERNGARN